MAPRATNLGWAVWGAGALVMRGDGAEYGLAGALYSGCCCAQGAGCGGAAKTWGMA